MLRMPEALGEVLTPFARLLTKPTWQKAQVLLGGALLTPRQRTVAALRVMGLAQQSNFAKYHQVLNRACWSTFEASRILVGLLLRAFARDGTLVFGLDETLERRWGKNIQAKGIYRDAVSSSHSHFVKCSGQDQPYLVSRSRENRGGCFRQGGLVSQSLAHFLRCLGNPS